MPTREDYIAAIGLLVSGSLPLGESEQILAISMAMKTYSRHKPRKVVEAIDGDGGFDYPVSGLAAWADDFSEILDVEYPVDDDDETADMVDRNDWHLYEKPAGKVLRMLADTPAVGETLRATYTALHTCTDSACTVSTYHEEAVQALAAAYFCEMLAAYYSQAGESMIDADAVDHSSRASQYANRAKAFRMIYYQHLGIDEKKAAPACGTADWDVSYPGGVDRLTHPKANR